MLSFASGFLVELSWIAVWTSAVQHQAESRPLSRPRAANGDLANGPPSWIRRAVGSLPSSIVSPRNNGNYLQRRGPQRAPKIKSVRSTVSSPRPMGHLISGNVSPPDASPKGRPLATATRSKRIIQHQHTAAEGASKGPLNGGGASCLSLNHSSAVSSCLNRASSNNSSEGTEDNSGSSSLPTEMDPMRNGRRRCIPSNRLRRRRGQQLEPRSSVSLAVMLCCLRWFCLLLFLSAPLYLFLLLLPIALVGWLQVPASLCLFGAHVPRLVIAKHCRHSHFPSFKVAAM